MTKKLVIYFLAYISVLLICINFLYWHYYKSEIDNVQIIQEFCGGNNNYQYTYLRIILPNELYHNEKTLNAIKLYIEKERGRGIQNWLRIVLYENWDDFVDVKEYEDYTFNIDDE